MIKQLLLVGTGGAVGSILRYVISEVTNKYYFHSFPLATFITNILGCFCIGLFINLIPANTSLKLLLIVGFCGGFTTFSTFARETLDLINHQQMLMAFAYTILSCLMGICAVWIGMLLSR